MRRKKWKTGENFPTAEQLEKELLAEKYRRGYRRTARNIICILIFIAIMFVFAAVRFLPILEISGNSMNDTLHDGDIVISIKTSKFHTGDVVTFYHNNKLLVKRVIAGSGDIVEIDPDGNTSVNGQLLDESYVVERSLGDCNLTFPYQVPDGKVFVMGDHRSVSMDSRSTAMGSISKKQIVGRIVFRIWPLKDLGKVR